MNKITALELHTILVLYQTRSFTLSGKVLHKVPTAVSYTLNTLEKRLQIKLFNKNNKKLIPTIAGKYLAGKAAQILDEMETTLQNTISLAEDFEPDLKIAVNNITDNANRIKFIALIRHRIEKSHRQFIFNHLKSLHHYSRGTV